MLNSLKKCWGRGWRAPSFWWNTKPPSWMMEKLGYIYGHITYRFYQKAYLRREYAPCPVISLGSLLIGGSGKTPMTIVLANLLKKSGRKPVIVTRGYGGNCRVPVQVDLSRHSPEEVGEEALLLAQHAPTYVSRRRAEALFLIPLNSSSVLLLDDAHQHSSLYKDLSFLVITQQQGWGNDHVFPAGPLREFKREGLSRAQGIFLIQDTDNVVPLIPEKENNLPCFLIKSQFTSPLPPHSSVIGFAGIGYPQRFHTTLTSLSLNVVDFMEFPDHFLYTPYWEDFLCERSRTLGAQLVTTEKDWIKLSPSFRSNVSVIFQELVLENEKGFLNFLKGTVL